MRDEVQFKFWWPDTISQKRTTRWLPVHSRMVATSQILSTETMVAGTSVVLYLQGTTPHWLKVTVLCLNWSIVTANNCRPLLPPTTHANTSVTLGDTSNSNSQFQQRSRVPQTPMSNKSSSHCWVARFKSPNYTFGYNPRPGTMI